ncbi:unnamed protein product [Clonostachys rosea f. rosea IK726]|uniref:Uncharacterized protein n=1 Tax=Clonostachys rosea f. rosea IK726 TaxID=1349383 RepID=A0ACA9TQ18_BIOOC|nr:unnamed protein product [Clonostachys rosea f. rosea IK726]
MLVLVAGVSGNLGQRLASAALARGLQVRGLGRKPERLSPELLDSLESFVKSDSYYDIPAIEKAMSGIDSVISAYTSSPVLDLDGNLLLLRAAERAQIKIFVASSWNNDWTNIKFGDFENYDAHIAFEKHVALTSPIKPVYFFTGIFTDLIYSPYGPGGFELKEGKAKMSYWGNGNLVKYPWSATEDIAAWTIEILMNGKGVQEGKGGFFRFCSGENTVEEFAAIYQNCTGTEVEVVNEGRLEDLEAEVARDRETKGRAAWFEYLPKVALLLGNKGSWKWDEREILDHVKTS